MLLRTLSLALIFFQLLASPLHSQNITQFGTVFGDVSNSSMEIYRDKQGAIYHAGTLYEQAEAFGQTVSINSRCQLYLAKLTPEFELVWIQFFDICPTFFADGDYILVDDEQQVYFSTGAFTVKLNAEGEELWRSPIRGRYMSFNANNEIEILQLYHNGNLTLGGEQIFCQTCAAAVIDTAGNYLRHFQAVDGIRVYGRHKEKNYIGINTPGSTQNISQFNISILDSTGQRIQSKTINYNYNFNFNSNFMVTHDPIHDVFYVMQKIRNTEVLRDSFNLLSSRLAILKLDKDLNLVDKIDFSDDLPTGSLPTDFCEIKAYNGSLYFAGHVPVEDRNWSHIGQFLKHRGRVGNIIYGKLDNRLRVRWFGFLDGDFSNVSGLHIDDSGCYISARSGTFRIGAVDFAPPEFVGVLAARIEDGPSIFRDISGCVFRDDNQNGIKDSTEVGLPSIKVSLNDGSILTYTDSNGNYLLSSLQDSNEVWISQLPAHWQASPTDTLSIVFDSLTYDSSGINFGLYADPEKTDLSIQLEALGSARLGRPAGYLLHYQNRSIRPVDAQITLSRPDFIEHNNSLPPLSLQEPDQWLWDISQLQPFQQGSIHLTDSLQVDVALLRDTLLRIATILPDSSDVSPDDNRDTSLQIISGPYDPNDIQVTPECGFGAGFRSGEKKLDYRIRFQNIGNDTAFNVLVSTTLDAALAPESFELVSTSHPAAISVEEGIVTAFFENIQLPDSLTDPVGSNGFIKFRIALASSTLPGVTVRKKAQIYFDFNPPITTNTSRFSFSDIFLDSIVTRPPSCYGIDDATLRYYIQSAFDISSYTLNGVQQSAPLFDSLAPGDKAMVITDVAGCVFDFRSRPTSIAYPDSIQATFDISPSSGTNGIIQVVASGGTGDLSYSLDGIVYQSSPSLEDLAPGDYEVYIQDRRGCLLVKEVTVPLATKLAEAPPRRLYFYPNPNRGQFWVVSPHPGHLSMYDLWGQLVHEQPFAAGQTTVAIPTKSLHAGIYLLRLQLPDGQYTDRLVIQ
ncbi:MAG: T9SS type A sorting domain-containing protein [Bacteroidota bacterium]